MATGYVYDPAFLAHDLPSHPENAERLRAIWALLEEQHILDRLVAIPARPATQDELYSFHTPRHVSYVQLSSTDPPNYIEPDTYVGAGSYKAATLAAGGLIAAVDATLDGRVDNAFALLRPPGHHALADRVMGFCLFNNVVLAARAALQRPQVERVLIVDYDVHHGNGTQAAFAEDPAVLYCSTHQSPYYPGTGHWLEVGSGAGEGTLLNVPLPGGVGDAGYAEIFEELLYPVAVRFRPDLILVSAGFDAHWADPLAGMRLSLRGYANLNRSLLRLAAELCQGRLVFTLEGGYEKTVLAYGALNVFHTLLGEDVIMDPLGPARWGERSVSSLVDSLKRVHRLE